MSQVVQLPVAKLQLFSETLQSLGKIRPLREPSQPYPGFGVSLLLLQADSAQVFMPALLPFRVFRVGFMISEISFVLFSLFTGNSLFARLKNVKLFIRGGIQKQDIEKICRGLTHMAQKVIPHCEQSRLPVILDRITAFFFNCRNICLSQDICLSIISLSFLSGHPSQTSSEYGVLVSLTLGSFWYPLTLSKYPSMNRNIISIH